MKLAKNKFNFLGIIPARGGSKSIKNKNIRKINKKPLIYYTIQNAKNSRYLTDLIISTDSKIIANISKKFNVSVPFLRPKKLSKDKSNIIDTLLYTLKKMEKIHSKIYDYIVLLQPTSPNRRPKEIDECIKKIIKKKSDSLISLCKLSHPHPVKLKKIIKNKIYPFVKHVDNPPRQTLESFYMPTGNIYIVKRDLLLKGKITGPNATFDIIKQSEYVNIDNANDLLLAKIKLR